MLKCKEYLCNVSYLPLYQSLKMVLCRDFGKVSEKILNTDSSKHGNTLSVLRVFLYNVSNSVTMIKKFDQF